MTIRTRHVLDTIYHGDGSAWADADVTFDLEPGSFVGGEAIPATSITATTGADGAYDAELWCDEDGSIAACWVVTYPDGAIFRIDLPYGDGSPVLISSLREASPAAAVANLQTLVDAAVENIRFTSLGDAPSSYSGQSSKVVAVTLDESGLEFVAGGGAPTNATYITQTPNSSLSAEQALSALATGLLKNTTATGVLSIAVAGTDYSAPGHAHVEGDVSSLVADLAAKLVKASNLSDLTDASAARGNLGLGALAVLANITASLISDASANGRSLITAADYAAMRTLLGLVIGTNVQAYDAELAALAGLASAADKLPYFTGSGAAALTDLTSAARSLLDDSTVAAMLTTLGAQTAIAEARPKQGSTVYLTLPGVIIGDTSLATFMPGANRIHYVPIVVDTTITLDLAFEVTTNGGSGETCRVSIYVETTDMQPGALVYGSSAIAIDSAAGAAPVVKIVSAAQQLTPGRYLLGLRTDSASAAFRRVIGSVPGGTGLLTTMGSSGIIAEMRKNSSAYAAFPDPGTAWDTVNNANTGLIYLVFCQVTTP